MVSNISLEITALTFTLFVLYHFLMEKKVNDASNKTFMFFITVGIMDICFDIISTILIEAYAGKYIALTKICLTLLYLLQAALPYAFVRYAQSLFGGKHGESKTWHIMGLSVTGIIGILIIVNYFAGFFFYYDAAGEYHHGPLYALMYAYAGLYMATAGVVSIVHRKDLTFREFASLWEYLIIVVVSVLIQFLTGTLLTIGVGIGLGITMLYITISNPNTHVDTFTGVPDRIYFSKWMNERVNKGENINVIAMELFKLKWLNKAYGAPIADQMILNLVAVLNDKIDSAHLFRISGRRFYLEVSNNEEYSSLKKCLQSLFENPVEIEGQLIKLPAIICCVPNAERFENADSLIEYIDYMVSLADEGDDTILLQDEIRMMEGFRKEQEIERYMETAIAEDLFQVFYQPVYSVEQKSYVTMEALSRLIHPSLGHISPDVFIGIAERTGQIDKLSVLQLKRVCDFIKSNEHIMDKIQNIKINLSPQELLKEGHGKKLIRIIQDSGLNPSYFNFEITETVATEYSDIVHNTVREFVEAGIGLCLDDFGTGYANLNTVLKLPFSVIKLDRSLLSGILDDDNVADFYEKIVSILRSMGYNLVAEGVETKEEFELLAKWNVDMVQGYYFSRPLPQTEILDILN